MSAWVAGKVCRKVSAGVVKPRLHPFVWAWDHAVHDPVSRCSHTTKATSTAVGTSRVDNRLTTSMRRRRRAAWLVGRPSSLSPRTAKTASAPIRKRPETRNVHARPARRAAAHQRPARARSQAQKAAAQKGASVYPTMVNTVAGAISHRQAGSIPPIRKRAHAAKAEPIRPRSTPVTSIGVPRKLPPFSNAGSPGKNAISRGSAYPLRAIDM